MLYSTSVRFKLSDIEKKAGDRGSYYGDFLNRGTVIGDELEISEENYKRLVAKFRGIGDVVAFVAMPLAKAIDFAFGTDLQNCGGCADRQEKMNEFLPFDRE